MWIFCRFLKNLRTTKESLLTVPITDVYLWHNVNKHRREEMGKAKNLAINVELLQAREPICVLSAILPSFLKQRAKKQRTPKSLEILTGRNWLKATVSELVEAHISPRVLNSSRWVIEVVLLLKGSTSMELKHGVWTSIRVFVTFIWGRIFRTKRLAFGRLNTSL